MFLLGYAWQKGLVPVSLPALGRAIELNGTAVAANLQALDWGRRAAVDEARVRQLATPAADTPPPRPDAALEEVLALREQELTDYQDAALGRRYRQRIEALRQAEEPLDPALPVRRVDYLVLEGLARVADLPAVA